MESVCIMALGGTLLAMPGATGLGSDLARVQQESFNSIVNQDCKRISNAVSNSIVPKIVKKLFGDNAETLCRFSFVEDDEYSAQDYLDMAIKATSIGLKIDAEEFKKATKLSFIQTDEVWSPTPQDETKEWSPEAKEELRKEMEGEV